MLPYLCTILPEYIDDLYKIDHRVLREHIEGKSRKFICIVFELNNRLYCIPFSSPDDADYVFKNGKKRVKRSYYPTILRLVDNHGNKKRFYGKLLFNNMIPVSKKVIKKYNIKDEKDITYKNLVRNQYRIIRREFEKGNIDRYSKQIYKDKLNNLDRGYVRATVDFKKLEEYCLQYSYNHMKVELKPEYKEKIIDIDRKTDFSLFVNISPFDEFYRIENYNPDSLEIQGVKIVIRDEFGQEKDTKIKVRVLNP